MKKIILSVALVTIWLYGNTQQLPYTSQYMFSDLTLNPAVSGSLGYTQISTSIRSQWTRLEGAPQTQTLGMHGKVSNRIGLGGFLFNDVTGPVSEKGIQLVYSYHLPINNDANLSFGLGGMFYQHSIDRFSLTVDDPTDKAILNITQEGVTPEASFGILYYTDKYKVGFSVPQIFQNNIYYEPNQDEVNKLLRHYFIHGEYIFEIDDKIDVVPSSLIKMVKGAPVQFDINAKMVYNKKYWIGASYRNKESVVALIGLAFKDLNFGYSYDITMTEIKNYSSGTHEIFLALVFGKPEVSVSKFE